MSRRVVEEALKCLLCKSTASEPNMCVCCSSLVCQKCIYEYLRQSKECPHCQSHLGFADLVRLQFLSPVTAELQKLEVTCEDHSLPQSYFCKTCSVSVCSDCALFSSPHKGHDFCRLQEVYSVKQALLKSTLSQIETKISELSHELTCIDCYFERLAHVKEERTTEISTFFEEQTRRLEQETQINETVLAERQNTLHNHFENLAQAYESLQSALQTKSKLQFIQETQNLAAAARHARASQWPQDSLETNCRSSVAPEYESTMFELRNFSQCADEVVYSDTVQKAGLLWRLKVYPRGKGTAQGTYISVFLELLKGLRDCSKYEYRLELINHLNPGLCVIREFASDFESGQCWGYNHFIKIALLREEGYLDENDTLAIRFLFRAPDYFQQSVDQHHYIQELELTRNTLKSQIQQSQNTLAATCPDLKAAVKVRTVHMLPLQSLPINEADDEPTERVFSDI